MRLYQFLPLSEQKKLPSLIIGDQAVNAMVKNYVSNPNFGKKDGEEITAWNLMQTIVNHRRPSRECDGEELCFQS